MFCIFCIQQKTHFSGKLKAEQSDLAKSRNRKVENKACITNISNTRPLSYSGQQQQTSTVDTHSNEEALAKLIAKKDEITRY